MEYAALEPLFSRVNEALGIFIDEYEEEIIRADDIGAALALTRRFAEETVPAREAAEKFASILGRAQELGKQLLLSF